ncbi:MAG: cytochrome biosis protein, partial [Aeromicrobium sp.]|nr:cytochrome biosis protein [Aeromicrobium sp.]
MSSNAVSELGRRELTRWFWRQLTSMRTALMLLLLLAIAAVPGSLYPQRGVDARAVEQYFIDHPTSAPIMDNLGLFAVYSSPWFSAVYLLLMVSLVGCILPRSFVYLRAVRARPPRAPRNFARLPASASFETD